MRCLLSSSLAILLLIAMLSGCEYDSYVVEITPQGDAYDRSLTCWHEKIVNQGENSIEPLDRENRAQLEKIYGKPEPIEDGKKHVFSGRFTGDTPSDVGGAGSYTHWVTSLGTSSAYVERFRGNDDFDAEWTRRRKAADQLVDLIVGWARAESGDEPDFKQLYEFLDGPFRKDLKNLAAYGWTSSALYEKDFKKSEVFWIRFAQYLIERGYFQPSDVPALSRSFSGGITGQPVSRGIQRIVARKMGVPDDQPTPKSLEFLSNIEQAKQSWYAHILTTDLYAEKLAKWKAENPNPNATRFNPMMMVNSLIVDFLGWDPLSKVDRLEVRIHCGVEPFLTNGRWDADTSMVLWTTDMDKTRSLPAFCSASWSDPNEPAQKERFGRVVLTGRSLAQYVLWHAGLTTDERDEWESFLKDCDPKNIISQLKSFRFADDPPLDPSKPKDKQPSSMADEPRRLLLGELEEKK